MELNNIVTVTLTKRGADILNRKAMRLNRVFKIMLNREDYKEGDDYTGSLWMMFECFGQACLAGSEAVFTNLRKTL